ncbi:hypothetical protein [Actinomadura terrae]|uniref:hypothetical protein n=1 Tax=Actinomadura terrae TaxID=604353 RepID=UPI001FA80BCD|nr:hypothetical protein [Actinomadura terrae]
MSDRDVRERCRALIDTLEIPVPFDLDEFRLGLERRRGRSIYMIPITTVPGAPCGMWVRTAGSDYVFYEQGTSPLHRRHIIMHEIGHMLFGHQARSDPDADVPETLLPDLDPELVRSMLGRTVYDSMQELEAETFADLVSVIIDMPSSRNPDAARGAQPEQTDIVSRIEQTVGEHRRR